MSVVALVADVVADVVEQRGVLEPLTLPFAELVDGLRPVEQRQREPRHPLGVIGFPVAPLGEFHGRSPPHVRVAVDARDVAPMLLDVVEHQAFAKRQIAERDLARRRACAAACRGALRRRRSGRRAADRARVAAAAARGPVSDGFLAEPMDGLGRRRADCASRPVRARAPSPWPLRRWTGRARRTDDAIEAGRDDVRQVAIDLLTDMAHHLAFVAARQRILS